MPQLLFYLLLSDDCNLAIISNYTLCLVSQNLTEQIDTKYTRYSGGCWRRGLWNAIKISHTNVCEVLTIPKHDSFLAIKQFTIW